MSKTKFIKIPVPKWNWWQAGLFLAIIIFAFRVDGDTVAKMTEAVFKTASEYMTKK